MKKRNRKLNLTRETLTKLDPATLGHIAGEAATLRFCCQESVQVCSVQHTCWSCNATDTCA
jgi:hypothetical protein